MYNTFKDPSTGLSFTIPSTTQLSTPHALKIIAEWAAKTKDELLLIWKSKPINKDWSGDDNEKKESLFYDSYIAKPTDEPILLAPVVSTPES